MRLVQNLGQVTTNLTDLGIINQNVGLLINPSSGTVASTFVINSFFDNCASRGISLDVSGTGSISRTHFIGCWSSSSTNDQGVFIRNNGSGSISGIEFIGHMSVLNGKSGFQVNNATNISDIRILGGFYAGNTGRGITFAADVSEFSVVGACVGACANIPGNTQAGIQIETGSSDNYIIALNDLRGNSGSALVDNGTGVNKQIYGNLPTSITNIVEGPTVFNESGTDVDSRIEGDTDTNLFYTDAGNDRVGIGTSTPAEKHDVNGTQKAIRYKAAGTTLVAGDFALSAGWGTTASVSSVSGTDQRFRITVTSAGTGQGANPIITLTFKDGTWTTAPFAVAHRGGGSQPTVSVDVTSTTADVTGDFCTRWNEREST